MHSRSGFFGSVQVLHRNLLVSPTDGNHALRVHALDIGAVDANGGTVNRHPGNALGLVYRGRNRTDGLFDINHNPAAHAVGWSRSHTDNARFRLALLE